MTLILNFLQDIKESFTPSKKRFLNHVFNGIRENCFWKWKLLMRQKFQSNRIFLENSYNVTQCFVTSKPRKPWKPHTFEKTCSILWTRFIRQVLLAPHNSWITFHQFAAIITDYTQINNLFTDRICFSIKCIFFLIAWECFACLQQSRRIWLEDLFYCINLSVYFYNILCRRATGKGMTTSLMGFGWIP